MERRIISQVTSALQAQQADFDASENKVAALTKEIKEALWNNQQFWITIKADLISEGNQHPKQLKADLLGLIAFIDRHTSKVLEGEGAIFPLIEINTNIMTGLSAKATPTQAEPAPQ